LNLGLTRASLPGLAASGGEEFAWDAYRRLLENFGEVVLGVDGGVFDVLRNDAGLGPDAGIGVLQELSDVYEAAILEHAGRPVPDDPYEQLALAIRAVFYSWNSPRAKVYRELHDLPDDLGTAVTVQSMVFGNRDARSGTGVAFTRDPNSGGPGPYGDFLFDAQGEDVVSGRVATMPVEALREPLPEVYAQLEEAMDRLENDFCDMCDIEFTVESGRLWFLQVRVGKRGAAAAVRLAVDLVDEGLIDVDEALRRVTPKQVKMLTRPHLDVAADYLSLTTGLNASPGVACGRVCLAPDRVAEMGETSSVILVRTETSPHDLSGMVFADGILTTRGGLVSHAAIVARDLHTPAVVGASEIRIDETERCFRVGDLVVREGDVITIDGASGEVVLGEVQQIVPEQTEHIDRLLAWAHERCGADATGPALLDAAHRVLAAESSLTTSGMETT
jgi:pyruvate, orthophosphate dikinase